MSKEKKTIEDNTESGHEPPDNDNNNNKFSSLLEKLKLNPQKKLSVKNYLTVDSSTLSDSALTSPGEVPKYILQKLMIVDHRVRAFKLHTGRQELSVNEVDDNEDVDEDDENSHRGSSDDEGSVNPMDAFLALFHCCDDFLRQNLAVKLTACQLSVPFLLPHPDEPSENITMLLWALGGIKKSWKKIESGSALDCQAFVTSYPFPIVSFIRLGEVGMSKSKLLNEVMSDSDINGYRDFFFHKDCKGGGVKRKFVGGLVELCWYLSGGRKHQAFQQEMCFANLRGDAQKFEKQFSILSKISSVLILLLPSTNLDFQTKNILAKTMEEKRKVVLVFQEKREEKVKQYFDDLKKKNQEKWFVIIRAKKNNEDDFVMAIRGKIRQHTKDAESLPLNDLTYLVKEHGVLVHKSNCQVNITFHENIARWFKQDPKRAKTLLKLQSMIPTIADLERENVRHARRGDKSEEEYSNEIRKKLLAVRKSQKELLKKIDEDVRECLNYIPLMSEKERSYSLTVLKQDLDNMSFKVLAPLQSAYCRESIRSLENESRERRLTELEKEIKESSFGLEHVFREMAQIFLATEISEIDYAGVAAEMLFSGRSLELMDGDSSYIPLKWFNEVFDKLKTMTNNANIFVISVLGIQSSGKSTMLNTMFGLEFPVSAGRCTRGAFASLIPLSDSLRSESKYDYLLIVDTEGLRGSADPHLRQHDNELATFAIGIADLTIVNIFGENYNEMKEFLEIAVHSFMTMKLVKEKRKCQIVHQNVAALDASHELAIERMTLREKLDEMTKLAAIQENCETEFKELNDVLAFDENEDVFYIPSMLQGSPPMAPRNPEYGTAVQKIKEKIIKLLSFPDRSPLSISQFQERVTVLWSAILRENFIFSFRNIIEVRAYTSLDQKFLQESVNTMVIQMAEQEKATSVALKRSSPGSRQEVWHAQKLKIREKATQLSKIMENAMETFFATNEDKHTLEQWRGNTMNRIRQLKDRQEDELMKNCQLVFHHLESRQEIDQMKLDHIDKLLANAKEFLASVKEMDNVDSFSDTFEQEWRLWIKAVPGCDVRKVDVNKEMIDVLYKQDNETVGRIIQEKCKKQGDQITAFEKILPLMKGKLDLGKFLKKLDFWWVDSRLVQHANIIRGKAVAAGRDFANKILLSNERCRRSDLEDMCQVIYQKIVKETEHQPFKFYDEVIVDIILHSFANAHSIFETMENNFCKERNIKLDLETNLKPGLKDYFLNQCKKMKKEIAAATLFVDVLKKSIQSEINQCMGPAVAREILKIREYQSKGQFHAKMLIELGETYSFTNYEPYLQNPVAFLKNKLRESIEKQCLIHINSVVVDLLEREIENTKKIVFSVISSANAQVRSEGKDIYEWIVIFVEKCSMLAITRDTFSVVTIDEDLKDFEVFVSQVETQLNLVFQEILDRGVDQTVFREWQPQPYDKVVDLMFGCEECCPLCKALCDQTIKNHECAHSTRNHLPKGIVGFRKWSILVTGICTTAVAGNEEFRNIDTKGILYSYKDYQSVNDEYKSWSIVPDVSFEASYYWKWFIATYAKELATYHEAKKPKIPSSWKDISFEEAKSQIQKQYNL